MSDLQDKDQAWLRQLSEQLDKAEAQLDAHTLRDLRSARHKALSRLQKSRRLWQPVSLAAVAASVMTLTIGLQLMQRTAVSTVPALEDMQLLSTSDDLELYENLEFYQWLEFEARNG